jgi:SRSO17 transposase
MDWETSLDEYLEHLCDTIGHSDRHASLVGYCQGLMLPIARKSVEPLAAHLSFPLFFMFQGSNIMPPDSSPAESRSSLA